QDYERARRDLEQLRRQRKIVSKRSGVACRNRIVVAVILVLVLTAIVLLFRQLRGTASAGASRGFEKLSMLNDPRDESAAARLPDGRVLIVGGVSLNGQSREALRSAELYDPVTRGFVTTSAPKEARFNHTVDVLGDGTILIVGGES
ncbi:unnamed protein product, partial [marine sediment metagenome]